MISLSPAMRSSSTTTSKSLKPLLRRTPLAGTVRKVDDTDFDAGYISRASSPSKKPRVTFKDDVEEKVMVQYAAKGRNAEVIRAEVQQALDDHSKGDSIGFEAVKEVFSKRRDEDDDDEELEDEELQKRADIRAYVIALTNYTSRLNKSCSGLVQAVLRCEWLGRDEAFVKSYVQFIGSLASSQGSYVGTVLEMLITNFYGGESLRDFICIPYRVFH